MSLEFPPHIVPEYLSVAQGMTYYGVPIIELTNEQLQALVAKLWTELLQAQKQRTLSLDPLISRGGR